MEGVTDSISGPKESDVKLEVEENVEVCPKSEEKLRQIEEHEHDITEVEPLAGIPASDNVHSQLHDPLLVPSYVDGKIFDLPKGWIVERRPRTSLKYFGKLEKPRENSLFQRFKDLHKYLSARKGQQMNHQPENNHE
ncbi:hypothetical protein V6N12_035859 [Hibiscus sabdariffa]|uniref:MBD domain-containing protein n=1 Tax=Hibiscus sabdariffa TaxID=183260 RepID=A0ABR2EQM8_9ROSI